jgi:hypothetical protein
MSCDERSIVSCFLGLRQSPTVTLGVLSFVCGGHRVVSCLAVIASRKRRWSGGKKILLFSAKILRMHACMHACMCHDRALARPQVFVVDVSTCSTHVLSVCLSVCLYFHPTETFWPTAILINKGLQRGFWNRLLFTPVGVSVWGQCACRTVFVIFDFKLQ